MHCEIEQCASPNFLNATQLATCIKDNTRLKNSATDQFTEWTSGPSQGNFSYDHDLTSETKLHNSSSPHHEWKNAALCFDLDNVCTTFGTAPGLFNPFLASLSSLSQIWIRILDKGLASLFFLSTYHLVCIFCLP